MAIGKLFIIGTCLQHFQAAKKNRPRTYPTITTWTTANMMEDTSVNNSHSKNNRRRLWLEGVGLMNFLKSKVSGFTVLFVGIFTPNSWKFSFNI